MVVTEQAIICPSCSAHCDPGMNFCGVCGYRLRAASNAVVDMIEDYRRKLAIRPNDPNAHYNLALAYLMAKEQRLAELELLRVTELEPNFADPHLRLADLYLHRGERGKAREQFQQALEKDPDNPVAKRMLQGLQSN